MSCSYIKLFILSLTTVFVSCSNTDRLTKAHRASAKQYALVHTVYFEVEEVHCQALIEALYSVSAITQVHDLKVGTFKDLGDQRALKDYDVVMQMQFKDEQAYQSYQAHPVHLKLKKDLKPILSAPPATHDFIIRID